MNGKLSLIASIAALCLGRSANADSWGAVASGCVLDADSIANARAAQNPNDGSVHFAAGKTGSIYLTCAIAKPTCTTSATLWVTGEGGGFPDAYTRAILNRTGNGSFTGQTIYTGASYSAASRSSYGGSFSHTFNYGLYYYWIVIELTRTSTTYDITAWGAQLGC